MMLENEFAVGGELSLTAGDELTLGIAVSLFAWHTWKRSLWRLSKMILDGWNVRAAQQRSPQNDWQRKFLSQFNASKRNFSPFLFFPTCSHTSVVSILFPWKRGSTMLLFPRNWKSHSMKAGANFLHWREKKHLRRGILLIVPELF